MTGRFAAPASSRRRTGVVYGAFWAIVGSSVASRSDRRERLGERVERLAWSRSRSARSAAPRRRAAGSRPSAGGSRGRAAAWRGRACGSPGRLLQRRRREDELVHAALAEGQRQVVATPSVAQPRQQVVGVQHRGLARVAQALGAERADVRVGAHEARRSCPGSRAACRSTAGGRRRGRSTARRASSARVITGRGRNGSMRSLTAIGPEPGPPPPCGCVNDLCRLKWTMSKPMSPGPRLAHDRVEVRAVVVERRPDRVHERGDLLDVRVEDPERVGVREHQARDVVVDLRAQIVDVDAAVGVRADLDDLVAGHRHRRRVRAVRGVGREDLVRCSPRDSW